MVAVAAPPPLAPARRARRRPGIRPEIQALRALAVVLVVVYHLWPSALPGGFVGVDVFFVISGFLITALLLREIERTGRMSLTALLGPPGAADPARGALHAARRARRRRSRSCPPSLWPQFLAELRASALYVQNWLLAADAVDYFAVAEHSPSPVQHFWSLSVEEQFYLALAGARCSLPARGRRALVIGMAVLTGRQPRLLRC